MKCADKDLLLYAVTDRYWLGERTLHDVVKESLDGGVTFVQLREKHLDQTHFLEEAKDLKMLCKAYNVPFVINDNVDIALEMDADGVHVGQSDMEAGDVRASLVLTKLSACQRRQLSRQFWQKNAEADYLGVGAVFPTSSKDDATEVSYETLKAICQAVSIPVIAIGGITKDNVAELSGSGICGIAVISAIYGQKNIKDAAANLKMAVRKIID